LLPQFKKNDREADLFEIAEKKIEVTQTTDEEFMGKPMVFLNGIPTVVAGDGRVGSVRIELDGEKITQQTQFVKSVTRQ